MDSVLFKCVFPSFPGNGHFNTYFTCEKGTPLFQHSFFSTSIATASILQVIISGDMLQWHLSWPHNVVAASVHLQVTLLPNQCVVEDHLLWGREFLAISGQMAKVPFSLYNTLAWPFPESCMTPAGRINKGILCLYVWNSCTFVWQILDLWQNSYNIASEQLHWRLHYFNIFSSTFSNYFKYSHNTW